MDKKRIITAISIITTSLIVAVAAVLILYKNNETVKATMAKQQISSSAEGELLDIPTGEKTEESAEPEETTEPTETPKPTTSPTPKTVISGRYYIKVNTRMNTVTIYTKDSNGNYTIPVKAMVCSTGNATPKNSKFQLKNRWNWGLMFGGVYTQWETHITGDILFHSVPYLRQYDHASLEYWLYDKLGTTCSAGCVRLTVEDAKWIYDNCAKGTWVEFYSSSNPGPLGKPTAQKISGNVECRNWDPTDPHPDNPWNKKETPVPTTEPTIEPTQTPTPIVTPTEEPTTEPIIDPTKTPEVTTPTADIIQTTEPKATESAEVTP